MEADGTVTPVSFPVGSTEFDSQVRELRGVTVAAIGADCKSVTQKQRRFESCLPDL